MVAVKDGPEAAGSGKPTKVIVASDVNQNAGSTEAQGTTAGSSMITESTAGGEAIASSNTNNNVDLSISGSAVGRSNHSSTGAAAGGADDDDDDDDDDASLRMASATSTRSAPSIMQRPSSRGGSAFEMQWDEGDGTARMPRRLEKLKHSSKRRKGELTLDQLQRKLEAAEKRKHEYEQRIKAKVAGELHKVNAVANTAAATPERNEELENRVAGKGDKAEENREQHLKMLRERLRAKEEHARKVREKKRKLQQQGGDEAGSEA